MSPERWLLAGVATVAVSVFAGCADDAATSDGRLQVATTVAPITSIVANIGGDRVKITGIVPEGTNSHTFEPKTSDAELLSRVDVMFIKGLKLKDRTRHLAGQNLKDGSDIDELRKKS